MSYNSNCKRTVLPNWLLIPQHIFSIFNSYMCRPARLIQVPQFIYWAFMHHPSAEMPTCLAIHLHIISISYSSKCLPADLPDEYGSPSSSIEHFCIPIMPKCQLATYSPAYFSHFLLIQVAICRMNAGPSSSIVHFCILQVLTWWPAYYMYFYLYGP